MTHTQPIPTMNAGSRVHSGAHLPAGAGSDRTIAGVAIPDTPMMRDVTTLIREAEDDLLFDQESGPALGRT